MTRKQTVLVTGASSGIGRALAEHYLKKGATVGVCGRDAQKLADMKKTFPQAVPLVFDVRDAEEAALRIHEFRREAGAIDLAILNAGRHLPTDGRAFDRQTYTDLMTTNYVGMLNCLEPVISMMKTHGAGQIALMGSVAGYTGLTHAGAYCASKSAIMRLAETLKVELEEYGVDVKLISPGFVKTPLTDKNDFDMPFLMEIDEAVKRITSGLDSNRFEIAFPRRLAWPLKLLSVLPRPLYFRVTKRMLREAPQSRP